MKTAAATLGTEPPVTAESARESLKRHGKSFHLAGKFLPPKTTERCARLYRFCRFLDDLSDESADSKLASQQLAQIEQDLLEKSRRHPAVADFLDLAEECGFETDPAVELVRGVRGDLSEVAFETEAELKQYAYRVAGTVGLLMCGVMGVTDPAAFRHAIDLGVAMQLTNIARDVREDAQNGRRYLPAAFLDQTPGIGAIAENHPESHGQISRGVRRLLEEADLYYISGIAGIAYLPFRARLGILIAARLYQSIGTEIRRMDFAVWKGRAKVSLLQKLFISGYTLVVFFRRWALASKPSGHDLTLHRDLKGFPGAHQQTGGASGR